MRDSSFDRRALYVLFFLSGVSGLAYETVWLRMLIRVLGSTAYATAVVLAAFMAGLAVGSYVLGRLAARVRNQLRLYAALELGVGASALALTAVFLRTVPLFRVFHGIVQGDRFGLIVLQSATLFLLMLVPTFLMGGTLPVLSAHTRVFRLGFAPRIGVLYGLNTLGAVIGVLGSGLFTLGSWGETRTLFAAAGMTLCVALLAYALSRRARSETGEEPVATPETEEAAAGVISMYPASVRRMVGVAYALSGFVAMSYEIIWTRTFQIQVGTSIYAFSIMLAFYLVGIGVGSLVGGRLFAATRFPLRAFGFAQLGIALYGLLGLRLGTLFPPVTLSIHLGLGNAVLMPLLVVFPVTFVLGAMFPAVCRSYVPGEAEVSRSVGRLYSLNTLGCILGSLVCGFLFIGIFGTRGTMMVLAALNVILGVAIVLWERDVPGRWRTRAAAGGLVALTALACVLAPDPFMVAVKRAVGNTLGDRAFWAQIYHHEESVAATTTALGIDGDLSSKHLWVNGIGMTNLCVETKLMAHIPLLLHPDPKEVLVVCFGMGTTVRSVRAHAGVMCDVVELVPDVYDCFRYFHADGPEVLADPRIHCYADDGRNFLLMRPKTYDVITIDPAPPIWSAGTVNLYTREFFELCKARLNARGMLCLWVPPVEASETRMVMRTYHAVFPNTFVWRSTSTPNSGLFLVGFRDPPPRLDLLARAADEPRIAADLNEWGDPLNARTFLAELFQGGPDDVKAYVGDARIITDDRPYTEFPLWRSLGDPLYRQRLSVRIGPGRGFVPAEGGP